MKFLYTSGRRAIKITNQEKKQYLRRYQTCEREINRIGEEIERWESRSQKVTPSYHLAPGGGGEDRIQGAVDALCELRGEMYDKLIESVEIRREIERAIASVGDERLRLLLEYRYVDGMRWEEVAVRVGVSWQHVHRMHSNALDVIECDTISVI